MVENQVPQSQERQVMFQSNYDKEIQKLIETRMPRLIGSIKGFCVETGSDVITDPQAVAPIISEIEAVLQWMKNLYSKYQEKPEKINLYEKQIKGVYWIDGKQAITKLKEIQELEIVEVAVKHKLMDRVEEREPWEVTKGGKHG